jgi:hypothetical protein
VVAGDLHGPGHGGIDRMVGRLETEDEQVTAIVDTGGQGGLTGIDQATVGGEQPRLGHRPGRVDGGGEVAEPHAGGGFVPGSVLEPHPRLGDDAERALGPEEQPIG